MCGASHVPQVLRAASPRTPGVLPSTVQRGELVHALRGLVPQDMVCQTLRTHPPVTRKGSRGKHGSAPPVTETKRWLLGAISGPRGAILLRGNRQRLPLTGFAQSEGPQGPFYRESM